ncbi:MAG: type II secretion system protein M [Oligoflexia bacterium]|nr:type II secretion system protein M [Oligoflexia bacterium]
MESSSRLGQIFESLSDFLANQEWAQQLKAKWEELDPESQFYLRIGAIGGTLLLILFALVSLVWSTYSLKKEVAAKAELVQVLQNANDELRRLRTAGAPTATTPSNEPWNAYLTNAATSLGLGKENFSVSDEKKGTESDQMKESLFDLTLKKVTIRQIIRLSFTLENGPRPVKLRNLLIDTKEDPAGYMDATLAVSAFTPKTPGR